MATITVGNNSWVTAAECNDYLSEKFSAEIWEDISTDNAARSIITAFRWMNSKFSISATESASIVKNAQCELAFYVYENYSAHLKRMALQAQGVKEFILPKFEERFLDNYQADIPQYIADMLTDYNKSDAGGVVVSFERDYSPNYG